MPGDISRYNRLLEPIWAMAETFLPRDTVNQARSVFTEPCQLMIKVAEAFPEGLLAAGDLMAATEKRNPRHQMTSATHANKKEFPKNKFTLLLLVIAFAEIGKQDITLADIEKQLGDMLTNEYEAIAAGVDQKYTPLIAGSTSIEPGEIGQTLVSFFWEIIIGEVEPNLPPNVEEILPHDPDNILGPFEGLFSLVANPGDPRSKEFCRSIVRSWLEEKQGINKGNCRDSMDEATSDEGYGPDQPAADGSRPLEEEE